MKIAREFGFGTAYVDALRHQHLPQRGALHARGKMNAESFYDEQLRIAGRERRRGHAARALRRARLRGREAPAEQLQLRPQLREVTARQEGGGAAHREEPQAVPGQRGARQAAAARVPGQRQHHHRRVRGESADHHAHAPRPSCTPAQTRAAADRDVRPGPGRGQAPQGGRAQRRRRPLRGGAGDRARCSTHVDGGGDDARAVHRLHPPEPGR